MKKYFINDPKANFYSVEAYGENKRDALNKYKVQWYPNRQRLPKNVAIWEA